MTSLCVRILDKLIFNPKTFLIQVKSLSWQRQILNFIFFFFTERRTIDYLKCNLPNVNEISLNLSGSLYNVGKASGEFGSLSVTA